MSVFYCGYHQRLEDSDYVGFNVTENMEDVCDDAIADMETFEDSEDETT